MGVLSSLLGTPDPDSAATQVVGGAPDAPSSMLAQIPAPGATAPADDEDPEVTAMNGRMAQNAPYAVAGPYTTQLAPADETKFQSWVAANKVPFDPTMPVSDYDMRGFWQGMQNGDPHAVQRPDANDIDKATGKPRMHFDDFWKTPAHETFSRDSKYATPDAPHWVQNRYLVDKNGKVLFDDGSTAKAAPGGKK